MTRVLIIDDEQRLRDNLAEMLDLQDFETFTAQDGIDGLAKAFQLEPDVILCDVMMPNATGYDFLNRIKKTNLAHIPVILLSAKAEREDERKGMSLGADDYITKPFVISEVVSSIHARLDKARQIKNSISTYTNQSTYELSKIINGHEIRTALNIVSGMSLLMNDLVTEREGKTQSEQLLLHIQNSIYSIIGLTNNIYIYELLKSDIREAIFIKSNMDVLKNISELAQNMNRNVEVEMEGEHFTNPLLVFLKNYICCELVYNAIKFTSSECNIKLKLSIVGEYRCILVTDDGCGFNATPNDIKPFTKFHTRNDIQGLGLGLNNIKLIAEKLDGNIEIINSDEGCAVKVMIKHGI